MGGVENLEADRPHALPERVGNTEEPGGIPVTAFDSGDVGQRLKDVWDQDFTADGGGDAERFASVAFGVFQRAPCDLDARTGCQRRRQIDALFAATASSTNRRASVRSPHFKAA